MGYTTDFQGQLNFDRVLTNEEVNYIKKFNDSRRMKRDVSKLYELYKGEGGNPFLPKEETYGNEGEYFVGGTGHAGQDRDDSIIDYNEMMATPQKNNIKKWNVIIAPGEGDISANRQDVLSTLLLKH